MPDTIERMNAECLCVSLDEEALAAAFRREVGDDGFATRLMAAAPGLIARQPVFLSGRHAARMADTIAAIEDVARLPAYANHVLAHAPGIAAFDPCTPGVFMGYDFHLGSDGPKLIEINTNAGGALLNAYLASAQTACCRDVRHLMPQPAGLAATTEQFLAAFGEEWRRAGRTRPLRSVVILDDAPERQFLFPEFQLFQRLFERHGLAARIADPGDLTFADGLLSAGDGSPVDLVYNRLTDFSLEQPAHAALRQAYLARAAVVTPHPRAHALFADKRNLIALTDAGLLRDWGVAGDTVALLTASIARTRLVSGRDADDLWSWRADLFFKPARGFGSRAAYRGDKLTRRVWSAIVASGDYVAQDLVRPSQRGVGVDGAHRSMKVDLRNYTYDGRVQVLAARLYEGQTTNMRTPGGGFAPVFAGEIEAGYRCGCG